MASGLWTRFHRDREDPYMDEARRNICHALRLSDGNGFCVERLTEIAYDSIEYLGSYTWEECYNDTQAALDILEDAKILQTGYQLEMPHLLYFFEPCRYFVFVEMDRMIPFP